MKEFKEISYLEILKEEDGFNMYEYAIASAKGSKGENCLTIGWGGLGILWNKPCCTIYINKKRYSKIIFDYSDTFSVSFFEEKYQDEINKFYGRVSGKDIDKMHQGPLEIAYDNSIPYFKDAKLVIFASKMAQSDFDINLIKDKKTVDWYTRDGVHTIYYGQIIKVLKAQ